MRKNDSRREPYEAQLNKNAGFSLVELLIAVVVLAIIIVPFARSFVSSSRMNGNSRRLQRATTVAQDIVEGLKAYNIDELKEQFNNPLDGFYIVDSRLVHGTIAEDTAREAPGVYYFTMEDFQIQNVEYDALIKIDASVYGEGTSVHDNAFNVSDMAKPGSVIKNRDGSYAQPVGLTKAVLDEIQERFGLTDPGALPIPEGEEFSYKIFKNMGGKINRTIEVDIKKDHIETDENGNNVVYCNAEITFDYECKYNDGTGERTEHIFGRSTSPVGEIDHTLCAADITSGNFYLFYYPCYEAQTDTIIINNDSKEPFQVFIVKQVEIKGELDSEGHQQQLLSDAQLNNAEMGYKAVVNVNDTTTNDINNTIIRTNLGMNLVNSTFSGSGVTRPPAGQMPTHEVEKEDIPTQVTYKFNGAVSAVNVFGLAGTRLHGTGGNNILNDKVTEVIFDIEVSIYRQGAYAEGFPDSKRMVVIEGSKNN